jgi:methionyl-tRNA synthetase
MRAISFGQDGDFSVEDLLQRYASDLGNTLGNLLNRVLPFAPPELAAAVPGPLEQELKRQVEESAEAAARALDDYAPTKALEAIWAGLAAANHYVDQAAPWVAKKDSPERLNTIVTTLVEALEAFSVLVGPVMPAVADAMRAQLGLDPLRPEIGTDQWPFELPARQPGGSLRPGKPIFPRPDKEHHAQLVARFSAPEVESAPPADGAVAADAAGAPATKPTISYDDFAKLDARIGVIKTAERIKRKDKLLSLRVDVGEAAERHIIAGIAPYYDPADLVGKRVVVLCNLEPRKFAKKLVSEGMLLAATDAAAGQVRLLAVDGELPPGSTIS